MLTLKADYTVESPEIKEVLAQHGSASLPFLLIFPAGRPNEPIVLRDVVTRSQVIEALQEAGPSRAEAVAQGTATGELSSVSGSIQAE